MLTATKDITIGDGNNPQKAAIAKCFLEYLKFHTDFKVPMDLWAVRPYGRLVIRTEDNSKIQIKPVIEKVSPTKHPLPRHGSPSEVQLPIMIQHYKALAANMLADEAFAVYIGDEKTLEISQIIGQKIDVGLAADAQKLRAVHAGDGENNTSRQAQKLANEMHKLASRIKVLNTEAAAVGIRPKVKALLHEMSKNEKNEAATR